MHTPPTENQDRAQLAALGAHLRATIAAPSLSLADAALASPARHPLTLPPGLFLDHAERRRVERAAQAAAQATIDAITEQQWRAWRRRWDALAASVGEVEP